MIYKVFSKIVFPRYRVKWFSREQEFLKPLAEGEHVEIYKQDNKKVTSPVKFMPENAPDTVELKEIEFEYSVGHFLRILKQSDCKPVWQDAGIPAHVISRAVEKEFRECYRTSSLEALIFHAESPLRHRLPRGWISVGG